MQDLGVLNQHPKSRDPNNIKPTVSISQRRYTPGLGPPETGCCCKLGHSHYMYQYRKPHYGTVGVVGGKPRMINSINIILPVPDGTHIITVSPSS